MTDKPELDARLYNEYGQLLGQHDRRMDAKWVHIEDYDALRLSLEAARGELEKAQSGRANLMRAMQERERAFRPVAEKLGFDADHHDELLVIKSLADELSAANAKLAGVEKDAKRWQLASTSRNFGITNWCEFGMRTSYGQSATALIDSAIAALVEGGTKL